MRGDLRRVEVHRVIEAPKCPYGSGNIYRELCEVLMTFDVKLMETLDPNVTL